VFDPFDLAERRRSFATIVRDASACSIISIFLREIRLSDPMP